MTIAPDTSIVASCIEWLAAQERPCLVAAGELLSGKYDQETAAQFRARHTAEHGCSEGYSARFPQFRKKCDREWVSYPHYKAHAPDCECGGLDWVPLPESECHLEDWVAAVYHSNLRFVLLLNDVEVYMLPSMVPTGWTGDTSWCVAIEVVGDQVETMKAALRALVAAVKEEQR